MKTETLKPSPAFSRILAIGGIVLLTFGISELAGAQDQYQKKFGDYTVHYNLVNSTLLTEQIADRYDIEKDPELALLTISVRGNNAAGESVDKPSDIKGEVRDLIHVHQLDFEEFQDPHAVYYLAQVPVEGRAELRFDIDIAPEDARRTFNLQFNELVNDGAAD